MNTTSLDELTDETTLHNLADETADQIREATEDAVPERAGTTHRLQSNVAAVLDGALQRAEAERSDAVAALVSSTVKREIRGQRDELAEALAPMTGRMVRAYLIGVLKSLADRINRRLGVNAPMRWLKSLASGRPVSEIAINEALALEVSDLYLVRRGSGELLVHWKNTPSQLEDRVNRDPADRKRVLSAINDFCADTVEDDTWDLRRIDLGADRIYLRGSRFYLLAARCRGAAPTAVEQAVDDHLLAGIERVAGMRARYAGVIPRGAAEQLLTTLSAVLEAAIAEKHAALNAPPFGITPLRLLMPAIAVPLVLCAGWIGYGAYKAERVRSVAVQVKGSSAEIKGYPIRLNVSQRGRSVAVSGLAPSLKVKEAFIAQLRVALPKVGIDDQLTVVASASLEAEPRIVGLRRELASLETEVTRSAARRAADRASRRLEETAANLAKLAPTLDEADAALARQSVASIEKTAGDLRLVRVAVARFTPDSAEAANLPNELENITRRLRQMAGDLASLTGESAASPAPNRPHLPAADLADNAEALALEAERLGTIANVIALANATRERAAAPSLRDRLVAWTRAHAIFFATGTEYREADNTAKTLNELAELLKGSDVALRIVGYTDEAGNDGRNMRLSLARADKVLEELARRGVPPNQLIVVGRSDILDLSPARGVGTPNRRVEFEPAFEGENAE